MADPTFWSRMGFDGGSALGIAGVDTRPYTLWTKDAAETAQKVLDDAAAIFPEFDGVTGMLVGTLVDSVTLSQLDPANPQLTFPQPQQFRVSHRGATLDFHFHEGLPLVRGEPPMIWKTAITCTPSSP